MYTPYNNANEICRVLWLGDHVSSQDIEFLIQNKTCTKLHERFTNT